MPPVFFRKSHMRHMLIYIIKRIFMLIPVVIGITLFIFIVMSLAQGDPAALVLGADASYEEILAKRRHY